MVREAVLEANRSYAESFDKGDLPLPPSRRFAVVTCMDARLDPAKFLGLEEGDAHVIRNAGGLVSDDALRSLIISHWLLGTEEAFVIAHSGCGMLTFTNEDIHGKLADETGADATDIDFLPFPTSTRACAPASNGRGARTSCRRASPSPAMSTTARPDRCARLPSRSGRRGLSPGEARLRLPPDDARFRMLRSQSLAVPLVLSRACSLASFATVAA